MGTTENGIILGIAGIAGLGAIYLLSTRSSGTQQCPIGYHYDSILGSCVADPIQCPTGYHYDAIVGGCVRDAIVCQAGYHAENGVCVPDAMPVGLPSGVTSLIRATQVTANSAIIEIRLHTASYSPRTPYHLNVKMLQGNTITWTFTRDMNIGKGADFDIAYKIGGGIDGVFLTPNMLYNLTYEITDQNTGVLYEVDQNSFTTLAA